MRVINKDPSIYEKNIPSVIEKQSLNRFNPTNYDNPSPNLNNQQVKEDSKLNQDEIRMKNIEEAMKELDISKKKSTVEKIEENKTNKSLNRVNDSKNNTVS